MCFLVCEFWLVAYLSLGALVNFHSVLATQQLGWHGLLGFRVNGLGQKWWLLSQRDLKPIKLDAASCPDGSRAEPVFHRTMSWQEEEWYQLWRLQLPLLSSLSDSVHSNHPYAHVENTVSFCFPSNPIISPVLCCSVIVLLHLSPPFVQPPPKKKSPSLLSFAVWRSHTVPYRQKERPA